jgi:hypothetical protein
MMLSSPLVKAMFHLSWLLAVLCFLSSSASAQTCVPPPAGLVSWWPGGGNATDIVDSNDGTLQGDATFAPGMVGQAFSFDGIDDIVSVPNSPNLNFSSTSPMTVDLWAFRTGTSEVMHFVGKRIDCGDNSGINYQMGFNTESGEGLGFGAGFGNEVATGIDLPLNTWTHLAGTFDGTTYRFFIDGQLVAAAAGTLGPTNVAPLLIGGSGTCATFEGLIDEVEIFNRALSTSEIQAIFNAGSAGKCKETEVQEVTIEIKPGGSPNPINPKSHGVIPVAILSTETFDATTVDLLSVRFGPEGAQEAHNKGHIEDVNHDGKPDLMLHFRTQATGIQCGQTSASLTGETFDGDPIQGSDAIKTVGCKQ